MPRSADLAELLTELKHRSGRSYEWIASRVHAGKSSVQRYCTGSSVPPEFGTVERIARVCGADADDVAKLFLLWQKAVSPSSVDVDANVDAIGQVGEEALPTARPETGVPQRRRMTAVAAALVIAAAVGFLISGDTLAARDAGDSSAQWIPGPAWKTAPSPVPNSFFGVTVSSSSGAMPTFRIGAVRLWDSRTRWANIEPRRGEFDWSILDRLVSGAMAAGLPVLFVFGGTPAWANPTGPLTPYPDGSRAAAPVDLADWDTFVAAVVNRYRGRIAAYELWALANDRRLFNGSITTLVEMTGRASHIIRSSDPAATVVCPGMGNLWTDDGRRVLREFAEADGYGHCDVASIKMFQRTAADPPETMLELVADVDRLLHESGVHPRLWNTGTTYSISVQDSLPQSQARNHAMRFYLVGLYARDLNIERMYFYNWGSRRKVPIVLQADGGTPTAAALAVEQLQRWLARAHIRSCGHGRPIGKPDNVWQCDFTIADADRPSEMSVRWTDSGTAKLTAEPNAAAVQELDGDRHAVRDGDVITISEEPVLVEYR